MRQTTSCEPFVSAPTVVGCFALASSRHRNGVDNSLLHVAICDVDRVEHFTLAKSIWPAGPPVLLDIWRHPAHEVFLSRFQLISGDQTRFLSSCAFSQGNTTTGRRAFRLLGRLQYTNNSEPMVSLHLSKRSLQKHLIRLGLLPSRTTTSLVHFFRSCCIFRLLLFRGVGSTQHEFLESLQFLVFFWADGKKI